MKINEYELSNYDFKSVTHEKKIYYNIYNNKQQQIINNKYIETRNTFITLGLQ